MSGDSGFSFDSGLPRVSGESMKSHMNRRVMLVGTVESSVPGETRLKTCDGALVRVLTKPGTLVYDDKYAEVVGTVTGPDAVNEEYHNNLGNAFDMASYNQLVQLAGRDFPALFYQQEA